MLPTIVAFYEDTQQVVKVEHPTRTYKIDHNRHRIVGFVDEQEAMEQAIFKILQTERYDHLAIYNGYYGSELKEMIGWNPIVVIAHAQPRIVEALLRDERITSVTDFTTEVKKSKIYVNFTVKTIYGDIKVTEYEVGF